MTPKFNIDPKNLDHITICLITTFVIQKMGATTRDQLKAKLKDLGADVHGAKLAQAVRALQKRQIVAVNQGDDGSGTIQDRLELKSVAWKGAGALEMAHITDLLPKLLDSEDARALKAQIEGMDDQGESKKTKGNVVDKYVRIEALCVYIDPIYGSQIMNPTFDELIKRFKYPMFTDEDKIFELDANSGGIIIRPDVISGWFKTNVCRYTGLPDARAEYYQFDPIILHPGRANLSQTVLPVMNSQRGAGKPASYHTVRPGQFFWMCMNAPTKGALTLDQLEKFLHLSGSRPRRGLSPARGRRTGRFRIVAFHNRGPINEAPLELFDGLDITKIKISDKALLRELAGRHGFKSVPTELNEDHVHYLNDADKRLGKVNLESFDTPSEEPEDIDDLFSSRLVGASIVRSK